MSNGRPDRVECILGQGQVILGGGLEGVRISEEAAGFVRDVCLPVIEESVDQWGFVATAVWAVVHDIGVATRTHHLGPGEVTKDELVLATWEVVGPRGSGPCLKLKARLIELGFAPPAS
jgi:hypothetical protein